MSTYLAHSALIKIKLLVDRFVVVAIFPFHISLSLPVAKSLESGLDCLAVFLRVVQGRGAHILLLQTHSECEVIL